MDIFPEPYKSIRNYVNKSIIILVVLSVLGNIMIIKVMLKKENRNLSTSTFFMALAVSDLSISLFNSLGRWFAWMFDTRRNTISHDVWTFITIGYYSNVNISTWILICITVERLTSISMPYRYRTMCTKVRACVIILMVCVSIISLNIIYFTLLVSVEYDTKFLTFKTMDRTKNGEKILIVMDSITSFFLPVVIIILSSVYITIKLRRNSKKISNMNNNRSMSVTMTLLAANIVFVLTTSPFVFLHLINFGVSMSPYLFLTMRDVFVFLAEMNSTLNFYVYVLSGSKFRSDVKEILGIQKRQSSSETSP